MRLILILAGLAGLTVIAGPALAPAAREQAAAAGLVVVVDASGAARATGQVPRDFSVEHLKQRIPGIDLSGGVTAGGDGDPEEWARALDAVTIVIPRLRQGEARIAGRRIGFSGTLRPGFSAGATRGAIRLAGVAIRCLNDGGLTLEIGGHTDNIGDDAGNMALSRKRAMTVLLELIDRGVRADAITAVGFGETRPIAGNATEDGRARNRRITFEWSG